MSATQTSFHSDGDVRGAIRLLTSNDTIAPRNEDTLASLLDKHPPHPEPSNFPSPLDVIQVWEPVSPAVLAKAISSFYPGSAGGLDGLRPQILKDLTSKAVGDEGQNCLEAITKLVGLVATGMIPPAIAPIFFGATLTALKKNAVASVLSQ